MNYTNCCTYSLKSLPNMYVQQCATIFTHISCSNKLPGISWKTFYIKSLDAAAYTTLSLNNNNNNTLNTQTHPWNLLKRETNVRLDRILNE